MAIALWRLNLQPASFNGVGFFVDVQTRAGGRRIANHEYPKRDTPYAEDMGRKSRRFQITGYVIGGSYTIQRDALIQQLEIEGPGFLILPTGIEIVGTGQVTIENYSVAEREERGGIATFEMVFCEAGVNTTTISVPDTQGAVAGSVNNAVGNSSNIFSSGTSPLQGVLISPTNIIPGTGTTLFDSSDIANLQ